MSTRKHKRKNPLANLWQSAKESPLQTSIIVILVLVSLAIKINLSLTTPLNPGNTDPIHYNRDVINFLTEGKDISNIYWPWGYPYFLVPFYAIFGKTFITAKIINTLLSIVNAVLVFYLGRKLFNHNVGLVAGALMLFDPLLTFYATNVYTETLFITLVLGSMLLVMSDNREWKKLLFAGILVGYAAMIKPWIIVMLPAYLLWWVLQKISWKTIGTYSAILFLGVVLILTPWTIHNAINHKAFVPLPINGPMNFYLGNHEYGTLAFISNWPEESWAPTAATDDPLEQAAIARRNGVNYVLQDIPGFFSRSFQRFWQFWSHPNGEWYQRIIFNMGSLLTYLWIIWLLALGGLIYSFKNWKKHLNSYSFIILMTVVFSVTLYLARFKIPLMPFQHIYAAASIVILFNIVKQVAKS